MSIEEKETEKGKEKETELQVNNISNNKNEITDLTYKEVLALFKNSFNTKLDNLLENKKDMKYFLPFKALTEKLHCFLNKDYRHLIRLFSKEANISFAYVLVQPDYSDKNQNKLFLSKILFSPLKECEFNPTFLCQVGDKLINMSVDYEIGNIKFDNSKFPKQHINTVDKKLKELCNDINDKHTICRFKVLGDKITNNKLTYFHTVSVDRENNPKQIYKLMFVPILYNQNLTKEVLLLPYYFYPDEIKSMLENYNGERKIIFSL